MGLLGTFSMKANMECYLKIKGDTKSPFIFKSFDFKSQTGPSFLQTLLYYYTCPQNFRHRRHRQIQVP